MTAPQPDLLLAGIHQAAGNVTTDVAKLSDADVKASSALPGWTRGHVLAHLAGISNAMARQLEYAARGETVELYDGGMDGRNKAIDMAAGHDAATHQADVAAALDRVLRAFDVLPGVKDSSANQTGWWAPISYRGGVVLDGGLALWRELVIHNADLLTGRGPETWSRPFCAHLFDFLAARVPPEEKLVLQPLGLAPVSIGTGNRSTVVSGMVTDIAAWLAGREPTLGSLRASAAADGVDLPELLPWPSGTPTPKQGVPPAGL
ncbi:Maleylpyruvate isomerase, mycothiol-dependent [Arthrobacter sp. 9AX]|uniref:maleylpyruvate isomerase family mycothiol-dependent enzyme n=1 Tax=Arthrobacter sp. 9AX TaxID=2653131 RepID=UPI0012F1CB4E|nr:maleylpyruvate isomerase family mycothiol-dependent enzyme [Arthrobacter sp. 9AX]VXB09601.1 Maleylpyruvate isomerase, mycothiol-dependent [Arthrobacter sp. 9AX]